ncbi:chloride channel CLIC-like protein 1 isoform X1 [Bombina bombina]|uniref:chloride channel CLIC-like protein 1 isoform X1 n=1 Tax=Bombina bombina TaxID=8345 RepID=UPI00235A915C|nr:chloride channel CLIC-like protein 1 isoform X1 [Bombina bombina]
MESICQSFLKTIYFIKHKLLGFTIDEPAPPPPWSLESAFQSWNIYSKASFAASFICFIVYLTLFLCKKKTYDSRVVTRKITVSSLNAQAAPFRPLLDTWFRVLALFLLMCIFISLPWEWVRLYQIEVAKKTTVLSEGYSKSCYRDDLSLWATIKVWLSWNFSWNSDSCEDYYKALIVDPFWEVTPLMAISSAIGRIIIHPMEQLSHIVGRSLRNVMKEIPSQWQPLVFLLVPLVCITMLAVAYFRRKHTTIVQCQRNEIPRSRRKAKGVVQLRG